MKKIPQLSDLVDEHEPPLAEAPAGKVPSEGSPSGESLSGESAPGELPPAGTSFGDGRAGHRASGGAGAGEADGSDGALLTPTASDARTSGKSAAGSARGVPGAGKVSRSRARRYARERALQALYQWDLAAAESSDVRRQFIDRQDMSRVDVEYFERLFRGVSHDVDSVDESLTRALDRPIADLDPIERAILRVAAFELAEVLETPARVVINEGVEITKRFGADNGHRYVNGVLDRLAGLIRPREMRRG